MNSYDRHKSDCDCTKCKPYKSKSERIQYPTQSLVEQKLDQILFQMGELNSKIDEIQDKLDNLSSGEGFDEIDWDDDE